MVRLVPLGKRLWGGLSRARVRASLFMKTVTVGAMICASSAFGALGEKSALLPVSLKAPGETECPACKKRKGPSKRLIIESLKGAQEKTRLPDTARFEDARAGILI